MSRGPGRIERAVRVAFEERLPRPRTVTELCQFAYGVADPDAVEKKHRVAVLRAAGNVAMDMGWWKYTAPSRNYETGFYDPTDLRSYALAQMRSNWTIGYQDWHDWDFLAKLLDSQEDKDSRWKYVQPGGRWHWHVRIISARKISGDVAEALEREYKGAFAQEDADNARRAEMFSTALGMRKVEAV